MKTRLWMFTLGFVCAIAPARASMSYQSSSASFATQAGTDGLALSSALTFSAANLINDGSTCDNGSKCLDEYLDSADGIEFLAFDGAKTTPLTISGTTLETVDGDDKIKVIFTNPIGFAFTFTTTSSSLNLCMDPSGSGCGSGGTFVTQNGTGFIGGINDNPSPAALTTLWLYASSGVPNIGLDSYEFAGEEPTPEVRTLALFGSGLVLIGWMRLRRRGTAK